MFPLPTETELNTIQTWPVDRVPQLIEFIKERWIYDAVFTTIKSNGIEYCLVTCGWKGNEVIILALQKNVPVWKLSWKLSTSDGEHKFFVDYSWVKE